MSSEIRAVIVEDVEAYLVTIEKLVREVAPEVEIAGKASDLTTARKMIEELSPGLLFLDIQFEEEGATAFDLLNQIRQPDGFRFGIIFITAHLETGYYAEAFNYGALHFIEKPIDKEKLKKAIARAVKDHNSQQTESWQSQFKHLERQITSIRFPGKIIIEGNKFNEVVDVKEIILLEASGRYTAITLSGGKTIVACQNLGEFDKKLQIYGCFCRIHHGKIINLNQVKRYSKKERVIEMEVPFGNHLASKDRFREFLRLLEPQE